jgi:NAD(P)H-dependent FMN reductase
MKITAIIGSPHRGNTLKITQQVEKNMKNLGDVEFDYLFLKDIDLRQCIGCFNCLRIGKEFCPLKDDRDRILEQINKSDGVVFATPVYVMNVTSLMKNFIDRFAYICHRPQFFRLHAMVVATTGGIGLKEVKKYMSMVATVWGFRSVTTLGIATPPHKDIPQEMIDKRNREVDKASVEFYNRIMSKSWSPSLDHVIQFRAQRAIFTIDDNKEEMPADYEFYRPLLKSHFYVDAPVNFFKDKIAWIFERIVRHSMQKTIKKK